MLISCSSRSLVLLILLFINKPMVEDELIGVIARLSDTINLISLFTNPIPHFEGVSDLIFGSLGVTLIIFHGLIFLAFLTKLETGGARPSVIGYEYITSG